MQTTAKKQKGNMQLTITKESNCNWNSDRIFFCLAKVWPQTLKVPTKQC